MAVEISDRMPLKVIEPVEREGIITALREVWRYRELVLLLAWKDYRVRYRQTAVGVLWAVLQPVLAAVTFVLIFGRFNELSSTGVPYPLYVYSGLVAWQFFSGSVGDASSSLVQSSTMVTKVSFPRLAIPLSKVFVQLVDLLYSGALLLVLMFYFKLFPTFPGVLWFIPLFLLLFTVSASLGILFSAIDVKYRDVQHVLPYFIQLGLFVSPIIYQSANLGSYRFLLYLNPMTGIIDTFRSALFSLPFPAGSIAVSFAATIVLAYVGLRYFLRQEGAFSDII